jgi:hypothetical protein
VKTKSKLIIHYRSFIPDEIINDFIQNDLAAEKFSVDISIHKEGPSAEYLIGHEIADIVIYLVGKIADYAIGGIVWEIMLRPKLMQLYTAAKESGLKSKKLQVTLLSNLF